MAGSLTARHPQSQSQTKDIQIIQIEDDKKYDNGKGKKKSNLSVIVLGSVILLCFGFIAIHEHVSTQTQIVQLPKEITTSDKINNSNIQVYGENPYEGWQPAIPFISEETDDKCNSWRSCFAKDHNCHSRCRDAPEDFGKAPPRPGFTPDPALDDEQNNQKAQQVPWVPDVTVLRRMLYAGKDLDGNPWPPPLVTATDRELCEPIGTFGGQNDDNKKLLDAVPIRGMPLLPQDWTDAAFAAKKMKRQPKVLCMVYTMEANHHTNIRAIRETWGPGCDGFLAFSTRDDPRIPAISLAHDGPEEYENMWQKVRSIWRFVGTHYLQDFDFFFQGGEDLYVLPQNLRSVLADQIEDPTTQDFFGGRRFRWGANSDVFFNSGGAGYALSQATLRKFVETGLDHPKCFPNKHSSMEDVFIARCLKDAFNIGIVDTRDDEQRERFHPFGPGGHYNWRPPKEGKRDWYQQYNLLWPPKLGKDCCAPDSVSFHYLKKPANVRHIHSLLYFCD